MKGSMKKVPGSWLTATVPQGRQVEVKENLTFRKQVHWISPARFIALFYQTLLNLPVQVYSRYRKFQGKKTTPLDHHTFINSGRQKVSRLRPCCSGTSSYWKIMGAHLASASFMYLVNWRAPQASALSSLFWASPLTFPDKVTLGDR